jgi:hypothetical protein
MSEVQIDQEFFSAARRGLKLLASEEQVLLKKAVEDKILVNGSFPDDAGEDDLYSTSFGVQLSTLLKVDRNKANTTKYLRKFDDGLGLGFLHLVSLTRCWRFYEHDSLEIGNYSKMVEKLEYNHCADGAWNQAAGTHFSSVYGTFLAIAAYQNLDQSIPGELKIIEALKELRSADGAFGTDQGGTHGTTPSTAFATIILEFLEENTDYCVSWLLKQQHGDGGFLAVSKMPFGDMQSTVYTLMALHLAAPDKFASVAPAAKKFILSLQTPRGFCGHIKEEHSTLENTFLALVGLGLIG